MAWFGDRLSQFSNLTDQISSFTKEVLTETTEEVEDPAAELQVARRRVAELEEVNLHIRTEHEKLRAHCEEVTERLETSEYQISTISQEYRKLLQEKEEALNKVRADNERLRQEHKHLVSDTTAQSPLQELAGGSGGHLFQNGGGGFETIDLGGGEWAEGEYHDFSDVVTSQNTINELQSELARVKVESQHWRELVEHNTSTDTTALLREEIKDLQASLHREREQHEQELSSMATQQSEQRTGCGEEGGWREKCAELQAEVAILTQGEGGWREKCAELQAEVATLTQGEGGWREKCAELQAEVATLTQGEGGWREKCAELQAEVATLTQGEIELVATGEMNSQLQDKLRVLVRDKDELEQRLAESVCALEREKDAEVLRLDSEKLRLEAELRGLQGSISNHQNVISKLQEEHSLAQNEIKLLRNNIDTLEGHMTRKEATLKPEHHQTKQTQDATPTQAELNTLSVQVTHLQQEIVNITSRNSEEKERFKVQDDDTKQQLLEKERIIQELTASLEEVKGRLAESDVNRDTLSRELGRKDDEVTKYSKQLVQLRAHLLEVEERYTQEALIADERESVLRQQLNQPSANQDNQDNQSLREQLVRAQDDVQTMVDQRDDALLQMSNAQEQAHQNATSLRNLQTVLEQFQRDQSSELAEALKRSQLELVEARSECSQLTNQLEGAGHLSGEVVSLRQEVGVKDERIAELQRELESVGGALEAEKSKRMKSENVDRVDRALVKNLVLGYVHTTDAKKPEVLQLMGKILGFTEDELLGAMGRGRGKGWLFGLWSGPPTQSQQSSLSQLFIKFLESESSPKLTTPTTATPITGYVDSRTDPDRPSLATAALVGLPPVTTTSEPHPPKVESPSNQIQASLVPKDQAQSSILNNVLNS